MPSQCVEDGFLDYGGHGFLLPPLFLRLYFPQTSIPPTSFNSPPPPQLRFFAVIPVACSLCLLNPQPHDQPPAGIYHYSAHREPGVFNRRKSCFCALISLVLFYGALREEGTGAASPEQQRPLLRVGVVTFAPVEPCYARTLLESAAAGQVSESSNGNRNTVSLSAADCDFPSMLGRVVVAFFHPR